MTPQFTQRYKEIFLIVSIAAAMFSACFATYSYVIKPLMTRFFPAPLPQASHSAALPGSVQNPPKIFSKVLHFQDGAPLHDRTSTQRVTLETRKKFDFLTKETSFGEELIMIDDKPVHFGNNPQASLLFGKTYNTEAVFITDLPECPELVIICERETSGQLKAWSVSTAEPTHDIIMGGQLEIAKKDIFIANEILLSTPQPRILDIS